MRNPAPPPPAPRTLEDWTTLPTRFTAWYDDHFGLRDLLLAGHSALKIFVFGTSPSSAVVIGKDGWIFPTAQQCLEIWRGVDPLSEPELEAWRRSLESRKNWLAARKIQFLFVLAPSKPDVYPEYLPANLKKVGPNRVEQLARYLEEHSDVRVLDLRSALLEEKRRDGKDDFTYFPLGTHWNQRGGWAGARAIVAALAEKLPAIAPVSDRAVRFVETDDPGDTWAPRLYLASSLLQTTRVARFGDEATRKIRSRKVEGINGTAFDQDDASLPRAVVFNDSYADSLAPSLSRHFAHILFDRSFDFDVQIVESEHPDVVLQVYNDRALVLQHPAELDADRVERLSRAFDASRDVLVHCDLAANEPAITAQSGAILEKRTEPEGAVLAATLANAKSALELPALSVKPGVVPVLRVDLFYQTRAITTFQREQRVHLQVAEGRNTLYFEVVDPEFNGRLLLRPGAELGTYLLRSVEVRGVPR
jgi:hypothetical protein